MRSVLAAVALGLCACGQTAPAGTQTTAAARNELPNVASDASKSSKLADPNFPEDEVKAGWAGVEEAGRARIATFAADYLSYAQRARTTRQSTDALIALAKSAGAIAWDSAGKPKVGALLYWKDAASGSIALLRVGSAKVDDGLGVILASHDSALIRLTPNPIYEKSGLALFDTSIMGSLKLESWLHVPLALSLYQAPLKTGGKALDVVLGDDPSEPVFTIPDLLPHLSRKVQKAKLVDSPERLDAVAGFTAKAVRGVLASNGFPAGALSSVEATLVPAGKPDYVGVDRGLIAGANHHSRAVPFAAVQALLASKAKRSTVVILMGRDEQFYAGAGPEAHITNIVPKAIEMLASKVDALRYRRILARTRVLMFDHNGGVRNGGVTMGTRRDDSSPSAFRRAIEIFKEGKVATQLLQSSGWSDAREIASLDIDTVALGLPVSGVGMPYQLLSVFDLYQARAACMAWVTQ